MILDLLIVEDEAGIRNALVESIDWQVLGYRVCGSVASGIEAMEFCLKNPPDVIISDIVIPGIDGIMLVKYLKQKFNKMRFIIMTGHREFVYAKEALDLGVSAFLLKPIDYDELKQVLQATAESIQTEIQESLFDKANTLDTILNNLLKGYIINLNNASAEFRNFFHQRNFYCVVVVAFDFEQERTVINLQNLYGFCNSNVKNNSTILTRVDNDHIVFLCMMNNHATWNSDMLSYLIILQQRIYEAFKYSVSFGVSELLHDAVDVHKGYLHAVRALDNRFFTGATSVNFYLDSVDNPICRNIDVHSLVNIPQIVEETIKKSSLEKLPQDLSTLFDEITGMLGGDIFLCKSALICILTLCVENFSQDSRRMSKIIKKHDFFSLIISSHSLDSMKDFFINVILDLKDSVVLARSANKQIILERVMEYIHENYHSQISLSDVADLVYLSPAYLSTLISTETGKTFIENVNDLRIKKAIGLMQDTSLKSYMIATKVGFKDPQYFSLVFKKITGMSPSEYKQTNLKRSES